jgi:hypothetical protein
MIYAIVVLAAIVALALAVLYVVRQQSEFFVRRREVDRELESDHSAALEYDVPTGEDPAVILTALELAGYTATVETRHPHQRVLIAYTGDREAARDRIRPVIERAGVATPHEHAPVHTRTVRFADE